MKSLLFFGTNVWVIFRQRMEILIKDEILPYLDFTNFDTSVGCIKGKLITKVRNA